MKIKKNFFSTEEAKVEKIQKKDGTNYSVRQDRMRFFFPDEWMAFYDSLKLPKQKITFAGLVNTGARINELRNVKYGDIDPVRNSVILRMTKTKNKDGTRKMRVISISSQFCKRLQKLQRKLKKRDEDYLPILSTPAANLALKNHLRRIGIKDWKNFSIHNIRKSTEVWLLSLEIDSLKVSKHMGHDIKTAAKFYVSPDTFNYEDRTMMRQIIGDLYLR